MTPITGTRTPFSAEDDRLLTAYIAEYNPGKNGRLGNLIYQTLVNNKDGKWPWAVRHPWHSWRERYKSKQIQFDEQITTCQERSSISDKQVMLSRNNGKRQRTERSMNIGRKKPKKEEEEESTETEDLGRSKESLTQTRSGQVPLQEESEEEKQSVASDDYSGDIFRNNWVDDGYERVVVDDDISDSPHSADFASDFIIRSELGRKGTSSSEEEDRLLLDYIAGQESLDTRHPDNPTPEENEDKQGVYQSEPPVQGQPKGVGSIGGILSKDTRTEVEEVFSIEQNPYDDDRNETADNYESMAIDDDKSDSPRSSGAEDSRTQRSSTGRTEIQGSSFPDGGTDRGLVSPAAVAQPHAPRATLKITREPTPRGQIIQETFSAQHSESHLSLTPTPPIYNGNIEFQMPSGMNSNAASTRNNPSYNHQLASQSLDIPAAVAGGATSNNPSGPAQTQFSSINEDHHSMATTDIPTDSGAIQGSVGCASDTTGLNMTGRNVEVPSHGLTSGLASVIIDVPSRSRLTGAHRGSEGSEVGNLPRTVAAAGLSHIFDVENRAFVATTQSVATPERRIPTPFSSANLSPADQRIALQVGFNCLIETMSHVHGFDQQVVRQIWGRCEDLHSAESLLKTMQDAAEAALRQVLCGNQFNGHTHASHPACLLRVPNLQPPAMARPENVSLLNNETS
ncbi:hypothetical protein PILCRDRAFT_17175 [Piloderma croceum F 1598]|uniref:TERF2-interacting telomeric protein 1 Myb domain-containing protein n=1 Tax=Piloderma croceum (strain F 1598) TaxID=765440 RepID=A0A0C3AC04_PILCF|nr:hypothetical protein PILCRDRAFT_17175 [Piloderma croceum F 1598]